MAGGARAAGARRGGRGCVSLEHMRWRVAAAVCACGAAGCACACPITCLHAQHPCAVSPPADMLNDHLPDRIVAALQQL